MSRTGPGLPFAPWVVRHAVHRTAMQGVYIRLLDREYWKESSLFRKVVSTVQSCRDADEQDDDEPPSLIADSDDEL